MHHKIMGRQSAVQSFATTVVVLAAVAAGDSSPKSSPHELHVSATAAPGGDGSLALPFQNLQQCADVAAGLDQAVVCRLGPGRFRGGVEAAPGHPFSIVGAGAGVTTLDGTVEVPDAWEIWKGSIYRQTLPEGFDPARIHQAFINLAPDSIPSPRGVGRSGDSADVNIGKINTTAVLGVDPTWMSEARWPNIDLAGVLDLAGWAATGPGSRLGLVVDAPTPTDGGLAGTNVDWTGARATLNIGDRFTTYTRIVQNHTAGTDHFRFDPKMGPGPGAPPAGSTKWGAGGRYWLSGLLAGLDTPGEWHLNASTRVLHVWAPDSAPPGNRVALRTRDYCVDLAPTDPSAPVAVANLSLYACTWRLQRCVGCAIRDVNVSFASYDPEIRIRDVPMGSLPNVTLLGGNDSVVERVGVRWSNNVGIKVAGFRNTLRDVLVEDVDWLGTLDFPAVQIGFGTLGAPQNSTAGDGAGDVNTHANMTGPAVGPAAVGMYPRDPYGEGNVVTRTTVRRFGNAGIVTSQLANEISFSHVHHGGLIGNDDACVHADNTNTSCQNPSLPMSARANCTKVWHHNWVHDCREKCMRGDDRTVSLAGHHNVIWNCAMGPTCLPHGCDRNDGAGAGWLVKGDNNTFYATTIFNVSNNSQGSLVVETGPLKGWPWRNTHSVFFNSLAFEVTGKQGPAPGPSNVAIWRAIVHGNSTTAAEQGLADPENFNFSLLPTSPLRRAGAVVLPWAPSVNGENPDIGAYQTGEPYWVPGCKLAECA